MSTKTKASQTFTAEHQKMSVFLKLKFSLIVWIIYIVVRILRMTYRFEIIDTASVNEAKGMHPKGSFFYALWHENLTASLLAYSWQGIYTLASLSSDGEIISRILKHLGFGVLRGSSNRGGIEARTQIVTQLIKGAALALTVDGPRGPRRKAKPGIIEMAAEAQCAIIPTGIIPQKYWTLRSWDRFRIPKPFTRIGIFFATPLVFTRQSERKDYKTETLKLNEALEAAEQTCLERLMKTRV